MKYKFTSVWAVLLALAASLAISPEAGARTSASEDRNFDGQADVCQLYDEDGDLVAVLRDRNFDRQIELSLTGTVAAETPVTSHVAPPPFLLARAVQPLQQRIEGMRAAAGADVVELVLQRRLLGPLDAYLPFINANLCYANQRLIDEIGPDGAAPP